MNLIAIPWAVIVKVVAVIAVLGGLVYYGYNLAKSQAEKEALIESVENLNAGLEAKRDVDKMDKHDLCLLLGGGVSDKCKDLQSGATPASK